MTSARLKAARAVNPDYRLYEATGLVFMRDEFGWWNVCTPADGVPVFHTYRKRIDAAMLRFASDLGWSVERVALACRERPEIG